MDHAFDLFPKLWNLFSNGFGSGMAEAVPHSAQ
jgi:hypothetical protein